MADPSGMLVLVVGPSGVGKDSLIDGARAALADDARYLFARREITRPADAGGEDHIPVDAAAFAARRASGAYALAWEAHGLGYGVPAEVTEDLACGRAVIVNASRSVIADARAKFENVAVILVTAGADALRARLAVRGRESEADVEARLARSVPFDAATADLVVDNSATLEEGVARFLAAIWRLTKR